MNCPPPGFSGDPSLVEGCEEPVFGVAQTPLVPCPAFYVNGEQIANCPTCMTGGPFTCPEGKFTSLISQADADAKADAYLASLVSAKCVSAVPVVTSATITEGISLSFSYQIIATNTPTSYGATGLPSGLSLDTATGIISGDVSVLGTYTVPVTGTNACGTGDGTITITIKNYISVVFGQALGGNGVGDIPNFLSIALDGGSPQLTITSQTYIALSSFEISGTQAFSTAIPGGPNTQLSQPYTWEANTSGLTILTGSTTTASTSASSGTSEVLVYPENDNTLGREITCAASGSNPFSYSQATTGNISLRTASIGGQVGAASSNNVGSFTGDTKILFD